jgi:hypothetical protein
MYFQGESSNEFPSRDCREITKIYIPGPQGPQGVPGTSVLYFEEFTRSNSGVRYIGLGKDTQASGPDQVNYICCDKNV